MVKLKFWDKLESETDAVQELRVTANTDWCKTFGTSSYMCLQDINALLQ